MFCPKCGRENADQASFCAACGEPLAAPGGQPAAPAATPASAAPAYAPPPAAAAPAYAPPPAAAPAYAPPPAARATAAPPYVAPPAPKKKRGCVIALVVVLFLTLCCISIPAAAYFGLVSLGKPRDLGVRYGEAEYKSAVTKLGIDVSQAGPDSPTATAETSAGVDTGTGAADGTAGGATGGTTAAGTKKGSRPVTTGPAAGTKVVYEGSRPIDVMLTSEEFSALMSMYHYSPNWLVQDFQVKFLDGNQMELSGYVVWDGRVYPGYAMATGELTGPRSVGGSISKLEGIGVEVPQEWCGPAAEYVASVMNEWLSQMEGLNLTSATVEGGQLHLVGTVPARVVRVPAGQ